LKFVLVSERESPTIKLPPQLFIPIFFVYSSFFLRALVGSKNVAAHHAGLLMVVIPVVFCLCECKSMFLQLKHRMGIGQNEVIFGWAFFEF